MGKHKSRGGAGTVYKGKARAGESGWNRDPSMAANARDRFIRILSKTKTPQTLLQFRTKQ